MPRIRQNAALYQKEDFLQAVRMGQAQTGLMHKNALADAAGMARSTLYERMEKPELLRVSELRGLIATIPIDPGAMLLFLGYSTKDIKKFKERDYE